MVNLSPVPAFPEYTGPYKVGTVDLEIPIKQLGPAIPSPDPNVTTLSVRVFYPCKEPSKSPPKTFWYPHPQQDYFAAYLKFLGSGSRLASFLSIFPRILYYISIPALQNAQLREAPTATKRWPTMVFSHGLGGTRNMYSQICGSIASHGAVVFAPEHRDGSAPVSFIRDENGKVVHTVKYQVLPHENTAETQQGRNRQLRQRLWELGETYSLAQALDKGVSFTSHAVNNAGKVQSLQETLGTFQDSLNVHDPGAVHFCGHSFGAATSLQFVKSVFYDPSTAPASYEPLYRPQRDSQIVRQIAPHTSLTLLDCWMLPTVDPSTAWLHDRPIPAYSDNGPGGSVILSILSEGFYRWRDNLMEQKRALSPNPSLQPCDWTAETLAGVVKPHIFYPVKSAHLSQSDFGVLFPWVSKKAFSAEEPERTLRLNVRAILEVWRGNGAELADTCDADMEAVQTTLTENASEIEKPRALRRSSSQATLAAGVPILSQDEKILLRDGRLRGWMAISLGEENPEDATGDQQLLKKDPGRLLKEGTKGSALETATAA